MAVLQNGQQLAVGDLLGGANVDSNGKALKFEQNKEASPNLPYFEAKGSDGKTYGFGVESAIVRVAVSEQIDFRTQRERGDPIPKKEAEKVDADIKKEREDAEKKRSAAGQEQKGEILVTSRPEGTSRFEKEEESESKRKSR